jgi:hypothetical protein
VNHAVLATINAISQGVALRLKNQALSRLDQLGLRLHFKHVPPGWIAGLHPADLSETWRNAGLPVSGVGYTTIGDLVEGTRTSSRFWPTSPFYQAWLGGYLLHGPPDYGQAADGAPDLKALLQIAAADQVAWLKNYNCPEPRVAVKPGSLRIDENTTHQDYPAWLVSGNLLSNSDVGAGNRTMEAYFRYRAYEALFERFNKIKLPPLCTLPPVWPLGSYHALELDWSGLCVKVGGRGHWALLYCCAARWAGRENMPALGEAALTALRQARIVSA